MLRITLLIAFVCAPIIGLAQTDTELMSSPLLVPVAFQSAFDSAHSVLLPKGYTCSVFYALPGGGPRGLTLSPAGNVCVSDMNNHIIRELVDSNHDGVVDKVVTLAETEGPAHNVAFLGTTMLAASPGFVEQFSVPDASGHYTLRRRFIDSLPYVAEGAPNHTTRTIVVDTISKSIFISVGAPCNVCRSRDAERATIMRFNLDGSGREIYATGLRNAVGLMVDPMTGDLWATVAERNFQGADLPGEPITRVRAGDDLGWPFAYGAHKWDDFAGDTAYAALLPLTHADSMHVSAMKSPEITADAHSTPLGVAVNRSHGFPVSTSGDLFITLHGSYQGIDGRLVANGSKILRAHREGQSWHVTDFATGFLTDSIKYTRWARPCGIVFDTAGNLYFSSDHSDAHTPPAIYRISYREPSRVNVAEQDDSSIELYPNPAANSVTVYLKAAGDLSRLQVSTAHGEQVSIALHASSAQEASFSTKSLPSGTYFITIPGSVKRKKLLVRH